MSKALVFLSATLVLTALAFLVWDFANQRQQRRQARQRLADRIDPVEQASTAIPSLRFGTPPPEEPVAGPRSGPTIPMPAWMLGAVPPSAAIAAAAMFVVSLAGTAYFSGAVAALALAVLLLVGGAFAVWLRVQKMRQWMVRQMPGFLDNIVRLIVVGNSTQAAFQVAVAGTKHPLRAQMDTAMSMVKAGMDVDQALLQVARRVQVEELFLMASILGLGVRYGGRSDVLLERVANYMRDREEADEELAAMSAETRLSAWILGLLPLLVGGVIIATNADYFSRMWSDPMGKTLVLSALALQGLGALLLYRLARLS